MIGFLHPGFLWLATLGAPVVLLYLVRRRTRRVPVSTLALWRRLSLEVRETTLLRRLKKLLSLLLQLLILSLVVLALARPYLKRPGEQPRTVVLLLDQTASMTAGLEEPRPADAAAPRPFSGRTRFDEARRRAGRFIDRLRPFDRMILLGAGSGVRPLSRLTGDARALREALRQAAAENVAGDPVRAVEEALAIASAHPRADLVFISDGCGWDEGLARRRLLDAEGRPRVASVPVRYACVATALGNAGITALQARRRPGSLTDFEVLVEVCNHHDSKRAFDVSLHMDDSLLASFKLDVEAHGRRRHVVPVRLPRGGVLAARLAAPDALPADDAAFCVVDPPRRIRALLVSAAPDQFLEKALAADADLEAFAVGAGSYPGPKDYDVVVFAGWAPPQLPPETPAVFINPPPDAPLPEGFRVSGDEMEHPLLRDADSDHPLLTYTRLPDMGVLKARAVSAPGGHPVLSSYRGHLVVAKQARLRRLCVVGFDFLDTDLPLKAAFPLFVSNLVHWTASRGPEADSRAVPTGAPVALAEALGPGSPQEQWRVTGPDGRSVQLTGPSAAPLLLPSAAGPYRFEAPGGGGAWCAASLLAGAPNPEAESDLRPRPALGIGETPADAGGAVPARLESTLAVAALLVLVLEAYLYHRRLVF